MVKLDKWKILFGKRGVNLGRDHQSRMRDVENNKTEHVIIIIISFLSHNYVGVEQWV